MKSILFITTIILLSLSSCITPISKFNKLEPPIIVVGISLEGSITLVDNNNTYVTIPAGYYLSSSLENYTKGDTLVYVK